MNNRSASFRLLKFLLAAGWWGSIVLGSLFVLIAVAVCVTTPEEVDFKITGYANDLDSSAISAVTRKAGLDCEIELKQPVEVDIGLPPELRNMSIIMVAITLPFFIACLTLLLLFLKQLREVVWSVERGDPFIVENARRVRLMGLLIMAGGIIRGVSQGIAATAAEILFIPAGFDLNGRFEMDVAFLVAGLSVLMLSEVFRHGSRMREEQEFTV
jgi:hypothetical protein